MSQGTPRSVNRGHLTSVFSGQVTSALTTPACAAARASSTEPTWAKIFVPQRWADST
jgi:hypothetical protein